MRKPKKSEPGPDSSAERGDLDAGIAAGGVAIFEFDGSLFHFAPPAMTNSLRFFLARLQGADEEALGSTVAITSALAGEGVTSVARSLAAVIAHDLDRSVCLLETNWSATAPPGQALPKRRAGLADVLTGSSPIDAVLVHTTEPRLALLTAGDLPVAARPAVVASSAFTDVVKMLTKVFDTIVIDAPPVLTASEAPTIVRHAEKTALVVRHGVTTEQQLAAAIDELRGTELLGVILNRSSSHVPKFLQRFSVAT